MNLFKLCFIALLISLSHLSYSQTDTCDLKISLLTCGPGEELYSLFGHSAIRIKEKKTGLDIIYNYGTFDFDDPDFYLKFTRGKLLYFVSASRFYEFLYEYQYEKRSVLEQDLNLDCEEKKILLAALRENAREENKYYHYDFVFDNCSTRLRDIVKTNTKDSVFFNNILSSPPPTFRDLIHFYLDRGNQPWSKFGIDLLLGSKLDKPTANTEAMFLPDYLMKGFDSATVNNKPLVSAKRILLPDSAPDERKTFFTPFVVSVALLVLITAFSLHRKKTTLHLLRIFDTVYFFTLGALGLLLLFMWFGTDHQLCADNYNLLWAFPMHLPFSFLMLRKEGLIKKYFLFTLILYILVLIAWPFIPQGMNSAFFPLALLAGVRSAFRWKEK